MFLKNKLSVTCLYIFFLYFFVFFIKFSTTTVLANTYKIKDLEISEPYALDFNKQKVMDNAFYQAFKELISKITTSEDKNKLNNTNLKKIKSLVDSFTIVDEKFVENKYFANFEVDFNKREILNFLERENIFPSAPKEKTLFLMPILFDIEKNQIFLFSENSIYYNWNKSNEKYFLINYIVPNEDLEDVNFIQQNINNIEDYDFRKIIEKYDLDDYIILIIFKNKNYIRTLSKVNLNNQLFILNKEFFDVDIEDKNIVNNLIQSLKISYENQWKKINLINTSIKLSLSVSLDSKVYKLINGFEKKMENLDLVSSFSIDKFSNGRVIYKIIYNSTPDKFISEIESEGFIIDTSKNIWRIK